MNNQNKTNVILVPGLFMPAWQLTVIKKSLDNRFKAYSFGYASRKLSIEETADKLNQFIVSQNLEVADFIGHSMGGLVIAEYLRKYRKDKTHTITLGSPLAGSSVARNVAKLAIGRLALAKQTNGLLHDGIKQWPEPHEMAVIAGTKGFCVGRIFGIITPNESDGTVALCETEIERTRERVLLPATHASMVINKSVIAQINHYLINKTFKSMPLIMTDKPS